MCKFIIQNYVTAILVLERGHGCVPIFTTGAGTNMGDPKIWLLHNSHIHSYHSL